MHQTAISNSEDHLSRRALIGGGLSGAAGFGGMAYGLTKLFSNVTPKSTLLPLVHVRQVMILIDQTESLGSEQRRSIRIILQKQVLPHIGPGDYVACYKVPSDLNGYDEVTNRLFGDQPEVLTTVRPELVGQEAVQEELKAELADQWHHVNAYVGSWQQRVEKVEPPANQLYSGYMQAMEYLNTRFADPIGVAERHLIVLGDLCAAPAPIPFEPPPCSGQEGSAYAEVKVALVRPFQIRGGRSRAEVDEFWKHYFTERGAREIRLWGLSDYPGLPKTVLPRV